MARKLIMGSAFISFLLLLSGCGLFGPKDVSSNGIDPPQLQTPAANSEKVNAPQAVGQAKQAEGAAVHKIYVVDADGFVVPWAVEIPKSKGLAKQVLNYMVKGSEGEKLLPAGFRAVLPAGTKVLGMVIKNGVATVDFSPEFKKYRAEDEQKILDAVTWALTEIDTIKEVNIQINGHPQDVMPINGTPISLLSRENGINRELADNVKVGQTMPVTIYFQGQVSDKESYFVPVTRLVPQQKDKSMAAMKELIQGPKQGSTLFPSMLPSTNVLSIKQQKDIMVVNFDNKLLSYNQGKANPEALEAIVLSLTENSNAKKVQIMVGGKATAKAGGVDYSKPVSRPQVINSQPY
ncbi:GerMN domain-containing protein [Aneurinibacillus tyrosinisolvens]|uniref:GerMN domain-containing protein n=1 Tax=Aneurinibacillus tyrosinisolvens TaxID=1443435 RepID=UPI00063F7D10|nr:GerMN domain-containing protein [Aneurinibacillus tyrosinisolvens]